MTVEQYPGYTRKNERPLPKSPEWRADGDFLGGGAKPATPGALPDLANAFTFLGDAPPAPPRELIRKLLPADGVAVTGGQSSAGKTFIIIHKAICLATM